MSVLPGSNEYELPNLFDVMAIDGAAVVYILPTTSTITLDEYQNLEVKALGEKYLERTRYQLTGWYFCMMTK